jgi:mannose-6-phosphate isomerase-like protein (cupin superfamily)
MIDTAQAERYSWGEQCDGWHLLRSADLSVIQERMPPGTQEVRHSHDRAHQFFYVLSGEATIESNGIVEILKPFQGIDIPAGLPHQVCNRSAADLEFIVVSAPPSHGDRTLL